MNDIGMSDEQVAEVGEAVETVVRAARTHGEAAMRTDPPPFLAPPIGLQFATGAALAGMLVARGLTKVEATALIMALKERFQ